MSNLIGFLLGWAIFLYLVHAARPKLRRDLARLRESVLGVPVPRLVRVRAEPPAASTDATPGGVTQNDATADGSVLLDAPSRVGRSKRRGRAGAR